MSNILITPCVPHAGCPETLLVRASIPVLDAALPMSLVLVEGA